MFLVALTYGFTHVFSGRGAFTQIGALIGTIMVANVFIIIIPYQKKTVAALIAGKDARPGLGREGKLRSVHNNYLTLPVIFLMVTNHYPLMFATRYNWLIVAIVLLIGPVIRHFYNSRHEGKRQPLWTWAVAAAGMIAIAWLSMIGGPRIKTGGATPSAKAAHDVVLSRCSMCHADEPVWPASPRRRRTCGSTTPTRSSDTPASYKSGPLNRAPCRPAISPRSPTRSARTWRPGAPRTRRRLNCPSFLCGTDPP